MSKDEKAANQLIAKLQKKEDALRAERRRRLANGFNRALRHLSDFEMQDIESVVFLAIGRSVVER